MFGLGFFEILVIAVVFVVAVGPDRLPIVMKKFAGIYRSFLQVKEEVRSQVYSLEQSVEISEQPKEKIDLEEKNISINKVENS
jgi:sec-independent protein translocase protein TatB